MIEQDNQKILKNQDGSEKLICLERGLETFTVQNYDASFAEEWWNNKKNFWSIAQNTWLDFIAENDRIKITEDEKLYMEQFKLAEKFTVKILMKPKPQRRSENCFHSMWKGLKPDVQFSMN